MNELALSRLHLPPRPSDRALLICVACSIALHAAVLGFVHPITGETLRFTSQPPADMAALEAGLAELKG